MSDFPETSVTLMSKLRAGDPGSREDNAVWTNFWDLYYPAAYRYARAKVGELDAEDVLQKVFGKMVVALRSGAYSSEKGSFHGYLVASIQNEINMDFRKQTVRKASSHISIDAPVDTSIDGEVRTLADRLVADMPPIENTMDEDWRRAVLATAIAHVLEKSAISEQYRRVYRAYAIEGKSVEVVAEMEGITRNLVSQIKTRIDKRIIAAGRTLFLR